jgi:hypothetical protein
MANPMKLGAIPRKRDPRDWKMKTILPATTTLTQKTWQSPIRLDQGGYGTCVFNAWTHYLTCGPIQHTEKVLLDPEKQPSYSQLGSSAYWTDPVTGKVDYSGDGYAAELYAVRGYDAIHDGILMPKDPERDDGAYTHLGAVILKRRGLIDGYYSAESVDDVLQAVLTHGPVVHASAWYRNMFGTYKGQDDMQYVDVDPASGLAGYHAYLIDAVNLAPTTGEPFATILNSWGPGWGKRGRARIAIPDLGTLWMNNAWIAGEVRTS